MNFYNELAEALLAVQSKGVFPKGRRRYFLIGNGGSAAVAAHIANDMVKTWRTLAVTPNYATLTCLANDYGWERAFACYLERAALGADDAVIAISSSGRSANIVNACGAVENLCPLVTLTGFDENNAVRGMGDCDYYVPSRRYGVVEIAHLAILHNIVNPD